MTSSLSSSSRINLLNYLAKYAYNGEIQLPRTSVNILNNFNISDGKYQCMRVDRDKVVRSKVEDFMLDNFYAIAPVPVVLELFKDCKKTEYLEDELNLWSNSGVSYGVLHGEKVAGAGLNLFVAKPVNSVDYVPAKDWHNLAAELSTSQTCHNPVYFWRNCQFLHLQHFNQHIINNHGASFGLHLGCLSLGEEYRGKDQITHLIIRAICNQVWDQGGVLTTVANFPAFEKYLRKYFPDNVHLVDSVKYKDLELTINGKRVFKPLETLDNIRYLALVR